MNIFSLLVVFVCVHTTLTFEDEDDFAVEYVDATASTTTTTTASPISTTTTTSTTTFTTRGITLTDEGKYGQHKTPQQFGSEIEKSEDTAEERNEREDSPDRENGGRNGSAEDVSLGSIGDGCLCDIVLARAFSILVERLDKVENELRLYQDQQLKEIEEIEDTATSEESEEKDLFKITDEDFNWFETGETTPPPPKPPQQPQTTKQPRNLGSQQVIGQIPYIAPFWGQGKYSKTTTTVVTVLAGICLSLFFASCLGVVIHQNCRRCCIRCCCCEPRVEQAVQIEMHSHPPQQQASTAPPNEESNASIGGVPLVEIRKNAIIESCERKDEENVSAGAPGLGAFASRKNKMDLKLHIPKQGELPVSEDRERERVRRIREVNERWNFGTEKVKK